MAEKQIWVKFQLSQGEWEKARTAAIASKQRFFLKWIRHVVLAASNPPPEKPEAKK